MESKRNAWIWVGAVLVIIGAGAFISMRNFASSQSGEAGVNSPTLANKTFSSARLGYSFDYPSNIALTENDLGVSVEHSVAYENSFCLAAGAAPASDFKDFNFTLRLESGSVADVAKKVAPEIPANDYEGNALKEIPDVILKAAVGPYESYSVIEGFKGCGTITYFLTVAPGKILVIKGDIPYPFTTVGGASGVAEKVLAVPGVIKPEDSVLILGQMIGSFKLL